MNLSYILAISCLSLVGCPPAKSPEPKVDIEEVENKAEIADLKEDIQELTEDVEEIKEDVEVLQLREDMREIKEDVAEIREDMEDLKKDEEEEKEEKGEAKHKHVNPYKFFNKKKSGVKHERQEKTEDKGDKINPLRLRRIVNFCASGDVTDGYKESCSSLMKLVMSLSELIEGKVENVEVKEDFSILDENEINKGKLRRSKRDA